VEWRRLSGAVGFISILKHLTPEDVFQSSIGQACQKNIKTHRIPRAEDRSNFDAADRLIQQSVSPAWQFWQSDLLRQRKRGLNFFGFGKKVEIDNTRQHPPFWRICSETSWSLGKAKDWLWKWRRDLMLDVSYFGDDWWVFFWGRLDGMVVRGNSYYAAYDRPALTICKTNAGCFDGLFCVFMCLFHRVSVFLRIVLCANPVLSNISQRHRYFRLAESTLMFDWSLKFANAFYFFGFIRIRRRCRKVRRATELWWNLEGRLKIEANPVRRCVDPGVGKTETSQHPKYAGPS